MADARAEARRREARAESMMRSVVLEWPDRKVAMREVPYPEPEPHEALVRSLMVGVDGTDEEVVQGEHGEPPPDSDAMVLGHECLGEVVSAPEGSDLDVGDLVVPLVRHGCGGCDYCTADATDFCPTDDFRERGIRGLDGFMRDVWTDDPRHLVKAPADLADVAVLTEPLSVVVKALDESRFIQKRVPWFDDSGGFEGRRALVAGTGSLGSLAALLLRHEGMEVWGMDRSSDEARAARIIRAIGATHVNAKEEDVREVAKDVGGFDLIIEATGAPELAFDLALALAPNGVMCMLGVPGEKPPMGVEVDEVMRRMVTKNQVLFGSVNSNRGHYRDALRVLGEMREKWPRHVTDVITHRYSPEEFEEALAADDPNMVKKVIDWDGRTGGPRGSP